MFQGSPDGGTLAAALEINRANGRSNTPPAAPVTVPCALLTATPPSGPLTSTENVAPPWMPGPLPRFAVIDTPGNSGGLVTVSAPLGTCVWSRLMLGVV